MVVVVVVVVVVVSVVIAADDGLVGRPLYMLLTRRTHRGHSRLMPRSSLFGGSSAILTLFGFLSRDSRSGFELGVVYWTLQEGVGLMLDESWTTSKAGVCEIFLASWRCKRFGHFLH